MTVTRTTARRGFTMLELMISIAILSVVFIVAIPPYQKLQSEQMCNNAAQIMASDVRRAIAEALRSESATVLDTGGNGTSYTISIIPQTTSGNYIWTPSSSWKSYISRNLQTDYGRTTMTGGGTRMVFGPKGWPIANGDVTFAPASVQTSNALQADSGNGKGAFYQYQFSAGAGLSTFTVKIYTNGRVLVDSP